MKDELIHESPRSRIFLVDDEQTNQVIVLKILNNDFPHENDISNFYNQADILDGLEIKGARQVIGRTRIKNKHALKMEYFQGVTLRDSFANSELDVTRFLKIAVEVCKILGNIHHAGIIHRDVNPSNILVCPEDNTVTFIDFEFSSRNVTKDYGLSIPTHFLGTINYCSPEQTGRINRAVDQRSDLYSLGASFYEILTGQPLFTRADVIEMVHAHIAQIPPLANDINPAVPLTLANIIAKLLKKNSEDRYQSVSGLQHDLQTCLNEYQTRSDISPFELGQEDRSWEFAITEKLYGRDQEITQILQAFDRAANGSTKCVLINGYSGTGKTALVHEVHKPITLARGFYIEGKYDQFQKSVPYSGILQAITSLIDLILLENEQTLNAIAEKTNKALGAEGKVLTNLIPNLELLIGRQPDIPDVAGDDARRRFDYVVDKFFAALCTAEHPIVMFVDDLQWADSSSLSLLNNLLTSPAIKHFLCICAYRSNEVPSGHPLHSTVASLASANVSIENIEITNLRPSDIAELIGDAVDQAHDGKLVMNLTELIIEKTQGNAFFATRFIQSLAEDNTIFFDRESEQWRWSIDVIRAQNITDNVVDFLTSKILTLPESTQEVLKIASAFGTRVDTRQFNIIYPGTHQKSAAEFKKAKSEGLMTQPSRAQFKFAHDRIVEAVYSLLEDKEKALLHKKIAQQLLDNSSAQEKQARLFEITNHFNQFLEAGYAPIVSPKEQQQLTEINYAAALKAKTNSAFQLSLDYLLRAKALLGDNAWESDYQLTYDIHKEITDVSYLCADYDLTNQYFNIVDTQARTTMDRVRVYEVKINAFKANNDLTSAIDVGLQALALLGKKLPRHPTKLQVLAGLINTEIRLKKTSPEKIYNLPLMDNEELFAAARIMVNLTPSAYWAEPNLLPMIAFDLVGMSLKHGLTELSAFTFAGYGIILCGVLEKMRRGQEYADLGLKLSDKFDSKQWITQIVDPVYALITHWNKHVDHALTPLRDSFYIGLETGENEFACVNANIYCTNSLLSGKALPSLEKETKAFSENFARLKQETQVHYNEIFRQTMLCLMGQADDPSLLQGEAFDTKVLLPIKARREDKSGLFMIYFNQAMLNTFFGQYDQALSNADQAMLYIEAVLSKFEVPNLYFYRSIAALGKARIINKHQGSYIKIAKQGLKKLTHYAKFAPENFLHKVTLIKSQLALVKNNFEHSRELVDLAIKQANEQGFIHEEALAYELGAYAYFNRDAEDLGIYYLNQAYSLYRRWGAQGKTEKLLDDYPKYLSKLTDQSNKLNSFSESVSNFSTSGQSTQLDMETLIKASLSLSSEVELPKLLQTLLTVVIENAGAQKGALILARDEQLMLDALLDVSDNSNSRPSQLLRGEPLNSQTLVPAGFVNYIVRTEQSIICNDFDTTAQKFSQETYFNKVQPESVMGLPILNQGRLVGVLYLENKVTNNTFTPDRVELLSILSGQMAVSLDNALLYQNLEDKVAERTEELAQEKQKSDHLLANILPQAVADELRDEGSTKPQYFESATVMFADFVGFTSASQQMSAAKLVSTLDTCFKRFDSIIETHGLEKIKTIGDSYMCAGGLPVANDTHAFDTIAAALDMLSAMQQLNVVHQKADIPRLELRIGVHTGPLVAGVVGTKKFAYDIWGNTVNQASRVESHGKSGLINISESTYQLIKDRYNCKFSGTKTLKNLGETNLYVIDRVST